MVAHHWRSEVHAFHMFVRNPLSNSSEGRTVTFFSMIYFPLNDDLQIDQTELLLMMAQRSMRICLMGHPYPAVSLWWIVIAQQTLFEYNFDMQMFQDREGNSKPRASAVSDETASAFSILRVRVMFGMICGRRSLKSKPQANTDDCVLSRFSWYSSSAKHHRKSLPSMVRYITAHPTTSRSCFDIGR
jgi:hypothetical protein